MILLQIPRRHCKTPQANPAPFSGGILARTTKYQQELYSAIWKSIWEMSVRSKKSYRSEKCRKHNHHYNLSSLAQDRPPVKTVSIASFSLHTRLSDNCCSPERASWNKEGSYSDDTNTNSIIPTITPSSTENQLCRVNFEVPSLTSTSITNNGTSFRNPHQQIKQNQMANIRHQHCHHNKRQSLSPTRYPTTTPPKDQFRRKDPLQHQ